MNTCREPKTNMQKNINWAIENIRLSRLEITALLKEAFHNNREKEEIFDIVDYAKQKFNISASDALMMYHVATFYFLEYDIKECRTIFSNMLPIKQRDKLSLLSVEQLAELMRLESYGDIDEVLESDIVNQYQTQRQIKQRLERYKKNKQRFNK